MGTDGRGGAPRVACRERPPPISARIGGVEPLTLKRMRTQQSRLADLLARVRRSPMKRPDGTVLAYIETTAGYPGWHEATRITTTHFSNVWMALRRKQPPIKEYLLSMGSVQGALWS